MRTIGHAVIVTAPAILGFRPPGENGIHSPNTINGSRNRRSGDLGLAISRMVMGAWLKQIPLQ